MPEISRFFGIVIRMYFNDHLPPHFHADYWQIGNERVTENRWNPFSHWSKTMEKIVSVKPLENYLLEIEFADGFRKIIDSVLSSAKEFRLPSQTKPAFAR